MDYEYDARFGQPVIKDGCGIFGVIRKKDAPKISNLAAVTGISCIKYRGSNLGAGFASFDSAPVSAPFRVRAFVKDSNAAETLRASINSKGYLVGEPSTLFPSEKDGGARFGLWEGILRPDCNEAELEVLVDTTNSLLLADRAVKGRIFSFGRSLNVYKEVGYPMEVARCYGLDAAREEADLWIAHTRQPTNSPGAFPIWSHPFASGECAIVHNGDISSFGANLELLNSWGLASHVGTDSEVIARLLDHLVRVEGLSVVEAATVLTNPFERNTDSPRLQQLLRKYRRARLDGPFAVVAGLSAGKDVYLLALTDRSKFRPILIGEDQFNYYVASEENQIRNLSRNAKVWTPDPGSFFIASVEEGIISQATTRSTTTQEKVLRNEYSAREGKVVSAENSLNTSELEFGAVNAFLRVAMEKGVAQVQLSGVSGHRYIGIGLSPKEGAAFKVTLDGFPGNCLANLNNGACFEVFGNVADDLADTMHGGEVIVHGSARDVVAQALQGGTIMIRGSVGNRAGIQMREYGAKRPYLLVGETSDDYLGEYMAGGVIAVLNLSGSSRPVGNYVGTGMVGGAIYIRGRVKESQIALLPQKEDILNYLRAALADGEISQELYDRIESLEYPSERELSALLSEQLSSRIRFLYFAGKYNKPMSVEYRQLNPTDLRLLSGKLFDFASAFGMSQSTLNSILEAEFTIIRTKEEKIESPIPPQEVPVEE